MIGLSWFGAGGWRIWVAWGVVCVLLIWAVCLVETGIDWLLDEDEKGGKR